MDYPEGCTFKIKYIEESSLLTCSYKGYVVFKNRRVIYKHLSQENGKLILISYMSLLKKLMRTLKEEEFQENLKEVEKEKKSWIQSIRDRWGI